MQRWTKEEYLHTASLWYEERGKVARPLNSHVEQAVHATAHQKRSSSSNYTSVAYPWHFGVDPCLWVMEPDPDPAIFIIDLQDANKKLILKKVVLLISF